MVMMLAVLPTKYKFWFPAIFVRYTLSIHAHFISDHYSTILVVLLVRWKIKLLVILSLSCHINQTPIGNITDLTVDAVTEVFHGYYSHTIMPTGRVCAELTFGENRQKTMCPYDWITVLMVCTHKICQYERRFHCYITNIRQKFIPTKLSNLTVMPLSTLKVVYGQVNYHWILYQF